MSLVRRFLISAIAFAGLLSTVLVVGHGVGLAQPTGGAVAGFTSIELEVAGVDGIPADAELAALHVAVAGSDGPGFATVWTCEGELPTASSVNYVPGQVVQSLVLAKLSSVGTVCVFVRETTDVIVDIAGYVPAGSDLRALDNPTRVVDTRVAQPLAAGEEFRLPVRGRDGVGSDAAGVGFTITALNGVAPGFLTVYPCGTPRPSSSSLNWLPGQFVPNFVIANVGSSGEVCVWALTETDILIDLVAWIPDGADGYELLERPERVFDSRDGTGTAPRPFGERETRTVPVDAPDGAVAVIGNLTATRQSGPGFATAFPCGEPVPGTASLNWQAPPVAVNASIGALGAGDEVCLFARFGTDLVYDVTGFVTSPDFFTPISPFRLLDSRVGWEERCPFFPLANVDGYDLLSTRTGDTIRSISTGPASPAPTYVLSNDCSELIVPTDRVIPAADPDVDLDRYEIDRFDTRTGAVTTTSSPVFSHSSELTVLDDGRVVAFLQQASSDRMNLTDIDTGDVLWTTSLLTGLAGDTDFAVSHDGTLVAYTAPIGAPVGEPRTIEVRRIADGALVTSFEVPPVTFWIDFTPNDWYLTFHTRLRGDEGEIAANIVTTYGGALVDGVTGDPGFNVHALFVGPGVRLLCFDGLLFRHELFGDIELMRDLGDQRFQAPLRDSCERTFR